MHASELIELAATVSAQGPSLILGDRPPSSSAIEEYWSASKCRLDRWSRSLRQFRNDPFLSDSGRRDTRWTVMRAVFEEILTGEILTRTFAAVISAYDRRHGSDIGEPAVRSVLGGQLEARRQMLTIILHGPGINAEESMLLNQLRRQSERWSDMLLGYLSPHVDTADFAVDKQRAEEFSQDLCHQSNIAGGGGPWALVRASLKSAFGYNLCRIAANPDLNARIARGVLACFSADNFDSTGSLHSLWMVRLSNAADDTQDILDEIDAEINSNSADQQPLASEALLERIRRHGCC